MKKMIYSVAVAMMFLLPTLALSQGYINWPATEDTIIVPANSVLNVFIGQDTAGTGPQGAAGVTAWRNRTRVYVLLAGQKYAWAAVCSLNAASRSLYIRGENGKDYTVPSTVSSVHMPVLRSITSTLTTAWFVLNAADQVFAMKNVCWTAYDEFLNPAHLQNATGTFVTCGVNARASVYFDNCILTAGLTILNYSGRNTSSTTTEGKTVRFQNCIIGDNGSLQRSNLGAGRMIDLRAVGVDTLDMTNNTLFNVIDRVIRLLGAQKPIFSVKFNHNTVQNCISYHGLISLGWIDSLGNGPFEIKNNLFMDPYALGMDTDQARQQEFTDNPDLDINGLPACSWFIAKKNSTTHVTPWVVSNNYYNISDSGKAIRDYETGVGLHHVVYPSTAPERIITSDMARQIDANGGSSANAFKKISLKFVNATQFPSKMCRWYFSPLGRGYVPTTLAIDSCKGAGEGKIKYATAPMPNFILLPQFNQPSNQYNQFPYDMRRVTVDSIMEWMDFSYDANWNLAAGATDGKIVGDPRWKFVDLGLTTTAVNSSSQIPGRFALEQNYPNPFNPTTQINYEIPASSFVTLRIVNILGQTVQTLVSEKQEAGSHPVTFDASRLASGVYFYQLTAGNFNATRKMVLMK
ncbi:MAG: T9SS C-terminal target domain-containing protein [Ignavibacteriae bacterium]|nr:MAG: T9SS C-terminal target domain-containing protein [Ignavibacteriota bacterium]